jgi:YidC/Oxa1 family membrane protein insertase
MMLLWQQFVEILRESIFAYAHACNGNLGAGILAVTFLARLALLPLGVRIARAAAAQQQAMARVQPQLDVLRQTHRDNPRRLAEETSRLMSREGVPVVPLTGCLGNLAQVPVLVAMYSAVNAAATNGGRFLWIRSLAQPDWLVAALATLLTVAATATGLTTPAQSRSVVLSVTAFVTLLALSKMAAGVGLYWGLSSLFGAVQGWIVQRSLRRAAA